MRRFRELLGGLVGAVADGARELIGRVTGRGREVDGLESEIEADLGREAQEAAEALRERDGEEDWGTSPVEFGDYESEGYSEYLPEWMRGTFVSPIDAVEYGKEVPFPVIIIAMIDGEWAEIDPYAEEEDLYGGEYVVYILYE